MSNNQLSGSGGSGGGGSGSVVGGITAINNGSGNTNNINTNSLPQATQQLPPPLHNVGGAATITTAAHTTNTSSIAISIATATQSTSGSGSGISLVAAQQQQSSSSVTPLSSTPTAAAAAAAAIITVPSTSTTTDTSGVNMAADSSPRESGDDSEDESEILEESPCGRWLKRREEVDQRDVPGIDCVHLAMDTEEGVEVVWNEVQYANLQELKSQEDKMRQVFDNLLQLDHPNIVKFHRYWTDTQNNDRPRVIFITEYMSSGSLKQFLKRTKRNAKPLAPEAWRRWCTQILSALSYLHSCIPPIVHGNLTCDSIFIQHNGLVKIGSVVPDAVHYSVRQHKAEMVEHGAHHFMAPEYGAAEQLTAAVDIYAFGMCALEMAALEIQSNSGAESSSVNEETILRTINSLENDLQRDLIFKCLRRNPFERPSASDLLFHPLLFEVHSLKLLAAHCFVSPKNRTMFSETVIDGMMQRYNRPDVVMAKVTYSGEEKDYRLTDVPSADKLEKFVEDVKFGVYPLTAFSGKKPPQFRSRAASPERADSIKSATPEPLDIESRRIVNMMCSVKKIKDDSSDISMTILLRMDDKMNRQLTCLVTEDDSADVLTNDLVRQGFVHLDDRDKLQILLEETLRGRFAAGAAVFEHGNNTLTATAAAAAAAATTASQSLNFTTNLQNNEQANGSGNNVITSNIGMIGRSGVMAETTTMPMNASLAATTNQMERNWSVADMESIPAMALQQQLQQQQQHVNISPTTQLMNPINLTIDANSGVINPTIVYVPQDMQQQHQILSPLAQQQQQHHHQHLHHHQLQQQQQQYQMQLTQTQPIPSSEQMDVQTTSTAAITTQASASATMN